MANLGTQHEVDIVDAVEDAAAYLYEHREEADHHQLVIDLRNLLFGVREPGF